MLNVVFSNRTLPFINWDFLKREDESGKMYSNHNFKSLLRTRETAQLVKVPAANPNSLSSVPRTHTVGENQLSYLPSDFCQLSHSRPPPHPIHTQAVWMHKNTFQNKCLSPEVSTCIWFGLLVLVWFFLLLKWVFWVLCNSSVTLFCFVLSREFWFGGA